MLLYDWFKAQLYHHDYLWSLCSNLSHTYIAAKDLCPSLHFEFHLPSSPCHFLEALDNLKQAYYAFISHAVESRRELWILVPPQLDSSDSQISCSETWSWCLSEADHHIFAASAFMCHLAVTHGSLLGYRTLLHTAGYSQWKA